MSSSSVRLAVDDVEPHRRVATIQPMSWSDVDLGAAVRIRSPSDVCWAVLGQHAQQTVSKRERRAASDCEQRVRSCSPVQVITKPVAPPLFVI